MSMITLSINLRQLKHMMVKGKTGQNVLCIPVDDNNFYHSEKGEYLNLVAYELSKPNPDRNDTHIIKQQLAKSKYESMTDEQRREMPILGNMTIWKSGQEHEPNDVQPGYVPGSVDDLPF